MLKLSFVIVLSCTMLATIFHDATVTIIMNLALVPIFVAMASPRGRASDVGLILLAVAMIGVLL
ncbi:MAG: hypothetical protein EA399_02740 [Desulfovibrionales bacterium]|nr:MAG: hypothetical protein EA399_02740 [Desulfovibrionales bacterium]